jgi:pimeloyl-ACP methyl ester carboxylesterase
MHDRAKEAGSDMPSNCQYIETSHGTLAVEISGDRGPDVVFIHGNSSCRDVFAKQVASPLLADYRLIRFDLPGHGQSSDAPDKFRTYSRPGLADAVTELLGAMKVSRAVVVGWSLGGHVAIEMLSRSKIMTGACLIGAPPTGAVMAEGFCGRPMNGLAGKGDMTPDEVDRFVEGVIGETAEPFLRQAVARTDRDFRSMLFAGAARGTGVNQRDVVTSTSVPLAMINGADDQIVNLDYIDDVPFSSLWQGRCFRIGKAGHAPFWQAPDRFNAILSLFLTDVAHR